MDKKTPQVEDGYTRIANGIIEDLVKINLSSYQTRVLLFIFRKTYGYGKREDWISVSQIVTCTGILKSHVSRAKSELLKRHLVTSNGNKISFQKDSSQWRELPKQVTVTNSGQKVTNSGQKLPVQGHTKETIQKKLTKEIYSKHTCNKLLGLFKDINPSYENLFVNKSERKSMDSLVSKYGEEKMYNLIINLQSIVERPYAPRITTPYELERKMGQLILFLKQEKLKVKKYAVTQL